MLVNCKKRGRGGVGRGVCRKEMTARNTKQIQDKTRDVVTPTCTSRNTERTRQDKTRQERTRYKCVGPLIIFHQSLTTTIAQNFCLVGDGPKKVLSVAQQLEWWPNNLLSN